MKGQFITLYGINNIGKSTHAKRLVNRLNENGTEAVYLKYPVYDLQPTGPFLNRILRSGCGQRVSEEELQLWFTLNRFQKQPEIEKWLAEGTWVVAEDYTGTGLAWGAAKGADLEWLMGMNQHLLKEDYALMLEGERGLSAQEDGHLHESDHELARRCQKVHRELAQRFDWDVVEVQPRQADTAELVWAAVKKRFSFKN